MRKIAKYLCNKLVGVKEGDDLEYIPRSESCNVHENDIPDDGDWNRVHDEPETIANTIGDHTVSKTPKDPDEVSQWWFIMYWGHLIRTSASMVEHRE